jgi:hypothetical protein
VIDMGSLLHISSGGETVSEGGIPPLAASGSGASHFSQSQSFSHRRQQQVAQFLLSEVQLQPLGITLCCSLLAQVGRNANQKRMTIEREQSQQSVIINFH